MKRSVQKLIEALSARAHTPRALKGPDGSENRAGDGPPAFTIDVRRHGISTRTTTVGQLAPRLRAASTRVAESIERMPASNAR